MQDSIEWKILKLCCDRMDLIIKASVTYSQHDYIVIDGLLIAATSGDDLIDTINATAKKAIGKIEDYSQQQKVGYFTDFSLPLERTYVDLDRDYHRICPLFESYIADFKKTVEQATYSNPFNMENLNAGALIPTNYNQWSWNAANYNQNYIVTKNYTTSSTNWVTVKEPRKTKVVKRHMLHHSYIERQNHIDESNVGYKMLLGLGWCGGPLGPNHDGIVEPISVGSRTGRSGLGCADRPSIKSTYTNINTCNFYYYLKQYADNDRQ